MVEKRIDNINPFHGSFTFRTTYGAPPTSSVSASSVRYRAVKDLGRIDYGGTFNLYNTTTGSLSSGSLLETNKEILLNGVPIISDNTPTTASIFELQFKESTIIKYKAKWEQNITTSSLSSIAIPVEYIQKTYKPSILNGTVNALYPTKKTVLQNGTIVIT
mgnify:FL=1